MGEEMKEVSCLKKQWSRRGTCDLQIKKEARPARFKREVESPKDERVPEEEHVGGASHRLPHERRPGRSIE